MSVKLKEAIKTGLAFMLVYYIAMQSGWMNPYWAGFTVAMIALGTAGQSIYKGMNRLLGTIPACIAALVILALAPQSRWLFMLLMSTWIFFTAFMMCRSKNHTYMWQVACFVSLIITMAGPGSSENLFEHAVFRTMETVLGIVVYTLVTVFVWPRTNVGAVRKAGSVLAGTQGALLLNARDAMISKDANQKIQELHMQEIQQLSQLTQALQNEGSESHEIHELRHVWDRFRGLTTAVMENLDRWQTGFSELARIDVQAALPGLPSFLDEIDERFTAIQRLLDGNPSEHTPREVSLDVDNTAVRGLSHLDRAALSVTRNELEKLEGLTAELLRCARELAGEDDAGAPEQTSAVGARPSSSKLPVFDPDHLRGAVFVTLTFVGGFLIWVFFDPPGHAGWYNLGPSAALGVALMPQARVTMVVKPLAVALAAGLAVYVFIMPQLSTFIGLGSLLFLCMFTIRYFFSGLAVIAGELGVLNMVTVQYQQTYHFAAMANAFLFTLLAVLFVFAMTYMLRSARPEKELLHLQRRFFRSAGFLVSRVAPEPGRKSSLFERWKTDFYLHELQTLPVKIGAWGKAIDRKHFPDNTPEQVQALVTSLQTLVYRIEELLAAERAGEAAPLARAMAEDIRSWRAGVVAAFEKWSTHLEAEPVADLHSRLAPLLAGLETKISAALEQTGQETPGDPAAGNSYRLLGGFRGVSEAAVAYAGAADSIDWAQWRQEVFA